MKELFQLIKSLDTNEKKYFRRFGLKDDSKGKSNTELLFDILDEAESFDEEKILFRLKREKLDKQLSHLKGYLYELLLDTLVWYSKDGINEFRSAFELAKANLLEDRGLDDEAAKVSELVVKRALGNGNFIEQWNALGKSIHFASNEFIADKKTAFDEVNNWAESRGRLLVQMQRYHDYDVLLIHQLRIMRKAMQARSADDLDALNKIFNDNLIQNIERADSDDSRYIYHTIRLHHFTIFTQWEEFYKEALSLINFIKDVSRQPLPIMRVLWAYAQLTQACYFTGRWKELEIYLGELNHVPVNNQTEKIARFTYYAQLAITLFDFKRDELSLKNTLSSVVANLKEFKTRLRPDIRLAITITCASAYCEYGEYAKALDLSEDFLTNYDSGVRLDALLMLYVYEFICHLEMGNMLYVNNTVQNVSRYFMRNDFKGEFETVLMKVFKKLSEISDYPAMSNQLQKLKEELSAAGNNVANRRHLALMPIVQNFIDAKLHGLKVHEYAAKQRTNR